MKKQIITTAIILVLSGRAFAGTMVPPEIPTTVEFSNRDINRVVCPGTISDLIFSKEKGLTGHFSGNSAYIKFSIEELNDKLIYAKEPSELYIVCNGATYSIVASPVDRQPATVRLAPPESTAVKTNIAHFKNMPLEKQALKLIKEGYSGAYPSSYKVTDNRPTTIPLCPDLKVIPKVTVDVDGVGLRLKVFDVTLLAPDRDVDEKTFLSSKIGDSILAVAVEEHKLKHGDKTRVFVVERKATDAQPAMSKMIKASWSEGE